MEKVRPSYFRICFSRHPANSSSNLEQIRNQTGLFRFTGSCSKPRLLRSPEKGNLNSALKSGRICIRNTSSLRKNTKTSREHPARNTPALRTATEIEFEKIKNLTDLIEKNLGVRPVSYRAARYGADLDTIKSLEKLGYKIDSSVTPHIDWSYQSGPDHSKAPDQPYFISADDYYSPGNSTILEVPISISKKRFFLLPDKWFFHRWLRPTHMTVFEMKLLVNEFLKKYGTPVLNMMFHSMEIIPGKTPFVKTALAQKAYINKLEIIIAYLKQKGFQSRTLERPLQ